MLTAAQRLADTLPPHLAERTRILKDAAEHDGEFVLYWMHHAARAAENPALDTAITLANHLRLPLLVYQGLAGNHRFNADRHHVFILQGAKDAANELAQLGITHALHLPEDPAQPSPLRDLANRAAAVVCEDFPAPPFPKWTAALANRTDAPVLTTDAACVVPMQLLGKTYDRAFKFRSKAQKLFKARVSKHHHTPEYKAPPFEASLPFEPVDLQNSDPRGLAARCDIDHTLPPIDELPGGSTAGYQRWEQYKQQDLAKYHKTRNNAAIHGVSRLSPYLHHGHIAPTRIAREASEITGDGPEKFIDELFVWREMAHNFCFYNQEKLDTLDAVPSWARDTLNKHARDERQQLLSWETLARAQSGDRLWDAAQRSLLARGELHNNIRMTWAKAILNWTSGPNEAHDILIDLNHRFALDGNDPNSYGGLLWALGAFDRPFEPEKPILGTVRPRDTATHAKRLDLERYENKITPPLESRNIRVAVIGAGIAGSYAARALTDQGIQVTAFDKARGPGGRASTRHTQGLAFDHGAQYFAAKHPLTRTLVRSWIDQGIAQPWHARFANIDDNGIHDRGKIERFVGVPGMNAIAEHLQRDITVRFNTRITAIEPIHDMWQLHTDDGPIDEPFHLLLIALPKDQAADLIATASPALAEHIEPATLAPAWTLMLGLDDPIDPGFDAAHINRSDSPLAWAACNSSKPGRNTTEAGIAQTWIANASRQWSRDNLEREPDDIAAELTNALSELTNHPIKNPPFAAAHRWRFALTDTPLNNPAPRDPDARIVLTGDWTLGPTIEHALRSANAAAGRVIHLARNLHTHTRETTTGQEPNTLSAS